MDVNLQFKVFLFGVFGLLTIQSHAQTCCSGGVPISTNLGLPPSFKGTTQMTLTYDINVLRTLKEGTNFIEDRARERITRSLILSVGHSITDRFSIEALLPYVRQERNVMQPAGFDDFESTQGIGDLLILFKYRITSVENRKHVLSLGTGPKLPTGSAREVNGRGLILSSDLQPGSGAWDVIFWGNYLYQLDSRPTMSAYSVLTYRMTGVNKDYLFDDSTYEIGNNFRILVGVSDQFRVKTSMVSPSLGFRYRHALEDKFNGDPITSTGGDWIFMVPGIGVSITKNFILESNVEIPVYANPRGTQLTPTYRFNIGLYVVFNPKDQGVKNLVD